MITGAELAIPASGIEGKNPRGEGRWNGARDMLRQRTVLLESLVKPLGEHASVITEKFNAQQTTSETGNELPHGNTRDSYQDFLTGEGSKIFELWFGQGTTYDRVLKDPRQVQLLKAIFYGFNKLKQIGSSGRVEPRTRKARIGDVDRPVYQIHTHAEIPFVLNKLGLVDPDRFAIVLGVNHDTTEEGVRAIRDENGIFQPDGINTHSLLEKFPERQIGRKLALGIQVLTEAELDEISKVYPSLLKTFESAQLGDKTVGQKIEEVAERTHQERQTVNGHMLENPLVYGGLALQVQTFVEKAVAGDIQGMSKRDAKALALSVINVEIADRIGDMAGLTRLADGKGFTPEYKRIRVMLYAGRMLNMMEKLQESARIIGASRQYKDIFLLYKRILEVELAEVNQDFVDRQIPPIDSKEFNAFYWGTIKPVQQQADSLMQPVIQNRVNTILDSAA